MPEKFSVGKNLKLKVGTHAGDEVVFLGWVRATGQPAVSFYAQGELVI